MRYFLGFLTTPLYYFLFGFFLAIFHPIQWLCYHLLGYKAHKIAVDWLNFFLTKSYISVGCRLHFQVSEPIPVGVPIIFAANHQSLYDIPPLIWYLRKYHAKFIAKNSLRNIPSISFNLKYGGGANIDRSNHAKAIEEIQKLGERMQQNGWSAVIFPEGTRSRNNQAKSFKVGGISSLLQSCPNAIIVPIAIQNSWKLVRFGKFPMSFGETIYIKTLVPITPQDKPIEKVMQILEEQIKNTLLELSA